MSAQSTPLKIALLSASYAPEPTGIGPYSAEMAEALAARGHAVHVVAAFPFYPAWRAQVPAGTGLYRTENSDNVRITRCRVYVPRNPLPARRLAHELSWLLAAVGPVLRLAAWADVWIVVSPSFGSAVLGALLARVFRARVHLHVQDVVPDIALESGQLGPGLLVSLVRRMARWTYRSYQSVSVLSESMAMRLRQHTGRPAKSELIAPNWVRGSSANGRPLPEELVGRPYALYAGSFGRKQDLALLTETATLLAAGQGPVIAVLGDGPGRNALSRASQGIVWLGLVEEGVFHAILRGALVGIVALAPGVGDSVVPSKLAAYLGAGLPVVVAADPQSEAARVVDRAACGVSVPPGRADLLADAVLMLDRDAVRCRAFAASALAYGKKNWDKARIVETIEMSLAALVRH